VVEERVQPGFLLIVPLPFINQANAIDVAVFVLMIGGFLGVVASTGMSASTCFLVSTERRCLKRASDTAVTAVAVNELALPARRPSIINQNFAHLAMKDPKLLVVAEQEVAMSMNQKKHTSEYC
jgi:hypothetical protein